MSENFDFGEQLDAFRDSTPQDRALLKANEVVTEEVKANETKKERTLSSMMAAKKNSDNLKAAKIRDDLKRTA